MIDENINRAAITLTSFEDADAMTLNIG